MFNNDEELLHYESYYIKIKQVFPSLYDWEIALNYRVYLAYILGDTDAFNREYSNLYWNSMLFREGSLN